MMANKIICLFVERCAGCWISQEMIKIVLICCVFVVVSAAEPTAKPQFVPPGPMYDDYDVYDDPYYREDSFEDCRRRFFGRRGSRGRFGRFGGYEDDDYFRRDELRFGRSMIGFPVYNRGINGTSLKGFLVTNRNGRGKPRFLNIEGGLPGMGDTIASKDGAIFQSPNSFSSNEHLSALSLTASVGDSGDGSSDIERKDRTFFETERDSNQFRRVMSGFVGEGEEEEEVIAANSEEEKSFMDSMPEMGSVGKTANEESGDDSSLTGKEKEDEDGGSERSKGTGKSSLGSKNILKTSRHETKKEKEENEENEEEEEKEEGDEGQQQEGGGEEEEEGEEGEEEEEEEGGEKEEGEEEEEKEEDEEEDDDEEESDEEDSDEEEDEENEEEKEGEGKEGEEEGENEEEEEEEEDGIERKGKNKKDKEEEDEEEKNTKKSKGKGREEDAEEKEDEEEKDGEGKEEKEKDETEMGDEEEKEKEEKKTASRTHLNSRVSSRGSKISGKGENWNSGIRKQFRNTEIQGSRRTSNQHPIGIKDNSEDKKTNQEILSSRRRNFSLTKGRSESQKDTSRVNAKHSESELGDDKFIQRTYLPDKGYFVTKIVDKTSFHEAKDESVEHKNIQEESEKNFEAERESERTRWHSLKGRRQHDLSKSRNNNKEASRVSSRNRSTVQREQTRSRITPKPTLVTGNRDDVHLRDRLRASLVRGNGNRRESLESSKTTTNKEAGDSFSQRKHFESTTASRNRHTSRDRERDKLARSRSPLNVGRLTSDDRIAINTTDEAIKRGFYRSSTPKPAITRERSRPTSRTSPIRQRVSPSRATSTEESQKEVSWSNLEAEAARRGFSKTNSASLLKNRREFERKRANEKLIRTSFRENTFNDEKSTLTTETNKRLENKHFSDDERNERRGYFENKRDDTAHSRRLRTQVTTDRDYSSSKDDKRSRTHYGKESSTGNRDDYGTNTYTDNEYLDRIEGIIRPGEDYHFTDHDRKLNERNLHRYVQGEDNWPNTADEAFIRNRFVDRDESSRFRTSSKHNIDETIGTRKYAVNTEDRYVNRDHLKDYETDDYTRTYYNKDSYRESGPLTNRQPVPSIVYNKPLGTRKDFWPGGSPTKEQDKSTDKSQEIPKPLKKSSRPIYIPSKPRFPERTPKKDEAQEQSITSKSSESSLKHRNTNLDKEFETRESHLSHLNNDQTNTANSRLLEVNSRASKKQFDSFSNDYVSSSNSRRTDSEYHHTNLGKNKEEEEEEEKEEKEEVEDEVEPLYEIYDDKDHSPRYLPSRPDSESSQRHYDIDTEEEFVKRGYYIENAYGELVYREGYFRNVARRDREGSSRSESNRLAMNGDFGSKLSHPRHTIVSLLTKREVNSKEVAPILDVKPKEIILQDSEKEVRR